MRNAECGIKNQQSAIRNPQSAIPQTLQQILARYQRHLVIRTGLLLLLGLGCVAALLWRLHNLGLDFPRLLGLGLVGLLALVLWQGHLIKRDWFSASQAALKLDRTLGLKARLLTAVEFANSPTPPLLYPTLVQDPALSLSSISKHLPHVTDRWTALFSVILLLLVLWPWHKVGTQQVAMRPPPALPPVEPPPHVPPDPRVTPPEQTARSESGGSAAQTGGPSQQQASQGRQQASQGPQSDSPSGQSGQQQATSSSGAQDGSQESQAGQGQPQHSQGTQGQADQTKSGQATTSQQASQSQTGARSEAQASKNRGSDSTAEQSRQDSQDSSSALKRASAQDQGSAGSQQAQQLSKTQGAGAGQPSSTQHDELKTEIQQLLKELSGELQHLQEQLAAQHKEVANPMPGTTTDPELYDAASLLEPGTGSQLPIQLDADQQPTSTTRRGGGVGEPSGQVGDAAPQQQPEEASLADQRAEEQAIHRQPIPPEYRPVFERLSHREDHP